MPTITTHTPQEISVLYGQLSDDEQNAISSLMDNFLQKKSTVSNKHAHSIMKLAGYLKNKTDIKLTDEELDEAIRRSYYARDEQ
ncbi:MAG: hypothetical protein IJ566_08525 [Cardiobacteriaceae bacterium]|nr:hypothetical protein [Cardiobacteriaceae bacterium]